MENGPTWTLLSTQGGISKPNSKSETRNPKQARMTKIQKTETRRKSARLCAPSRVPPVWVLIPPRDEKPALQATTRPGLGRCSLCRFNLLSNFVLRISDLCYRAFALFHTTKASCYSSAMLKGKVLNDWHGQTESSIVAMNLSRSRPQLSEKTHTRY
jgi:hypothetical protein